jgi:hypothetical protein
VRRFNLSVEALPSLEGGCGGGGAVETVGFPGKPMGKW